MFIISYHSDDQATRLPPSQPDTASSQPQSSASQVDPSPASRAQEVSGSMAPGPDLSEVASSKPQGDVYGMLCGHYIN